MKGRLIVFAASLWLATAAVSPPLPARGETLEDRVERMEHELQELKDELKKQRQAAPAPPAPAAAPVPAEVAAPAPEPAGEKEPFYRTALDRVKLGGYGSFRFEHNSLDGIHDTFTLRRVVLTADANIAPRLRSGIELEFERFRQLEVEKTLSGTDGGLRAEQAIEATNGSEISLEQAWLQFDLWDWLRLRGGALLVPVGRFNLNHDDNRWNLPRRPLVDRGAPVLPTTAAWDELGAGFNGDLELSDSLLGSYQLYVVNGVNLDTEIEQVAESRVGDTTLNATEVKVSPSTGTFGIDSKDAKAVTGRFSLSPQIGSEIATSFYWGRYTPDFLPDQSLYSISGDGLYTYGPFEIEAEYVYTHFGGIQSVARGFAERAIDTEGALENDHVENEVEFELAGLAESKQGYWIELRYSFWPQLLNRTVLGRPFENPRLVAVFRPEQVWFSGLVDGIDFRDGVLTRFDKSSPHLTRLTWGLAYRPMPLVAFQMAFEWYLASDGTSLSQVTNFLPAGPGQNEANAFLVGAAFGF